MKIPSELAELDQWVVWRYERRSEGKPAKVPYQVNGSPASTVDPTHWSTFENAWTEYSTGKWDGVGFVFSDSDDLIGIDLDNCIADGEIKPWAKKIIAKCNTYTESSPSGTGLKMIGRSTRQGLRGRRENVSDGQVEVYTQGRYFTITGEPVGPMEIVDIGEAVAGILPEKKVAKRESKSSFKRPDAALQRALSYADSYPPAIAGDNGHATTFRLACVLVNGFALSEDEALQVLEHWNDSCDPPWSTRELEHKVKSAADVGQREQNIGYMYDEDIEYEEATEQEYRVNLDLMMSKFYGSRPMRAELLEVPGFISDVSNYILSQNPRRNPVLGLIAAIGLQSVLAGRKVKDASGTRTNVYMIGLAPTAGGKQAPNTCIGRILNAVGCGDMYASHVTSDTAIVSLVKHEPALLLNWDEVGYELKRLTGSRTSEFASAIIPMLMSLWSSTSDEWRPKSYADRTKNEKINQPCVSWLGWSTPGRFWESMTRELLYDGFTNRLIVIDTGDRAPTQEVIEGPPPETVLRTVEYWRNFAPGGNLHRMNPGPRIVDITYEAKRIRNKLHERFESCKEEIAESIWSRSVEKANKLALIYAVSRDCESPIVDEEAMRWAVEFITWSTETFMHQAMQKITGESKFSKDTQKVLDFIREQCSAGYQCSRTNIVNQFRFESSYLEKVVRTLEEADRIKRVSVKGGRGRPKVVYVLKGASG